MKDVTVVIPTIPGRQRLLMEAVQSVQDQTIGFENLDLHIMYDAEHAGPAFMRNVGVKHAETEYVAFLDDDDYLLPHHLETLLDAAKASDADVVWPWFQVEGGTDPFPHLRGRQWDPQNPFCFPITTIVRRDAFMDIGGFVSVEEAQPDPHDPDRLVAGEDWRLWTDLSRYGAKFLHVNEVTWVWRHHAKNTSGLPERAKEMYL